MANDVDLDSRLWISSMLGGIGNRGRPGIKGRSHYCSIWLLCTKGRTRQSVRERRVWSRSGQSASMMRRRVICVRLHSNGRIA